MTISFSNVPSGVRVPLFYAEVDNSMANTGSNDLKTLLVGQMLSGEAEVGKPVLVSGDSQGKELFGRGSVLAIMNSAFRDNNTVGEVWAIPVDVPSNATAASGTFAVSGTATASGTINVYIGATRIQTVVAIDDTASTIASNIVAAINAKPDLPVTANAGDAEVTVSAKCKGSIGNDIQLAVNLSGFSSGETMPEGVSITVTAMSGGNGTPDLTDTITAMGDEEYDFIAMPYCDATCLDAMKTEMNDVSGRWSPTRQLYGHVYSAMRGTVANLQTFGSGMNDQHATVIGVEPKAASSCIEYIGAFVARCATAIESDPARPLQTLELTGISSAPAGSRFSLNEKQTLLTNGIATTYVSGSYTRIERAITTYQVNTYGDDDVSYLDSETLHTLAYIIRNLRSIITSKYPRHKLANDGTRYGAGQAIVTPSVIRGELIAQYQRLEERGIVENIDLFKKYLVVERNATDPNRVDVLLPPDLVNGLRVFAVLAQFRLQYDE